MKTLLELVDVRDPRGGGGRRKHVFKEILAIAILAKLSGAQTFNEMENFGKCRRDWLGTFLSLPHGIPSHDTFNRAIRSIPAEEFEACFRVWAEAMRSQAAESGAGEPRRIVAVDGKALRRARRSRPTTRRNSATECNLEENARLRRAARPAVAPYRTAQLCHGM